MDEDIAMTMLLGLMTFPFIAKPMLSEGFAIPVQKIGGKAWIKSVVQIFEQGIAAK